MRLGSGVLFRERPEIPKPRGYKNRCNRQLRGLRSARGHRLYNALELSTVAMHPVRSTSLDGWQHDRLQTLQNAFDSTGSIPGCFNIVLGSAQVANHLIESDTTAVSFTGSVSAGRMVAQAASSQLKKFVVELGGERLRRKRSLYAPTILTGVTPEMRIMTEETFRPAAPVMAVKDENEAIALANKSEFGLGATVWSMDTRRAEKVAREISAGLVTINNVVVSDPRMPFGGVRHSGIGRELSRYGMLEFTNIKSVRVYEKSPLAHAHVE